MDIRRKKYTKELNNLLHFGIQLTKITFVNFSRPHEIVNLSLFKKINISLFIIFLRQYKCFVADDIFIFLNLLKFEAFL